MKVYITKNGNYLRVYYNLRGKKISSNISINGDLDGARVLAELEKKRIEREVIKYGEYSNLSRAEKQDLMAARLMLKDTGITLLQAARGFLSNYTTPGVPGIPWGDLVKQFLATKKNLNRNTYEWYYIRLNRTLPQFGKVPVNEMDTKTVLAWINSLGNLPQTSRGYLQAINAAYRYAVRGDKNLANKNPFEYAKELIEKPQKRIKSILSPMQGHLILWAMADHWKAAYALRYYTGLRIQTLVKTDWGQVNPYDKIITVHPFADKKDEERFITDIPPEFWEWYRQYAPGTGPIVRSHNSFNAARRSAWARLEAIKRSYEFPPGALRRSFASYGIHTLGLTETILTMAHTGEPSTFWNHYYRRAVPATAKAYFGILPNDPRFLDWDRELTLSPKEKEPNFRRALKQWRKDWPG